MKKYRKNEKNIAESFFRIDETGRNAEIILDFERPEDIFDVNYATVTPVLNDDFMDWLRSSFDIVPSKYGISLTVRFSDMGNYSGEELADIFRKNIMLELVSKRDANRRRNRIAYSLVAMGLFFFAAMLLIDNLWTGKSLWRDIFVYTSDIATTVTFWEAVTILVVEQKENRSYIRNLADRFTSIQFTEKPKDGGENK